MRIRRRVIGLAILPVTALLVSCSHACTVIGADNGVVVRLDLPVAVQQQAESVQVCVRGTCVPAQRGAPDSRVRGCRVDHRWPADHRGG